MLFGGWKESCPQIANGPKEATKSEASKGEVSKEEVSKDEVSKGKAGEGEGPASKDEAGEGETGEVEVSKDEPGEDEASKDESTKDKASKGGLAESKKANDWIVELLEDGLEGIFASSLSVPGLIARTRVLLIEAVVKPYRSILSQMKNKTHPSNQIAIKNNCVKNCIPSGVGSLVLAGMTDNFNTWDPRLPFHFTGHLKLVVNHLAGIKITIPQGCGNCLKIFSDEFTNVRSVMTAALKCIPPLSKDQQMHLEKRASQLGLRVENIMDKGTMHILYALGS
ncbi:hypothetical protein CMEL01_11204 [Colletotrichum melonis]|uniref:Uncharacterized protein n=1 Tax=Colletotrichum melonis TaxID=1209925 RepID=A0AAI9UYK2_9PEZI|nr:hypothetical protein CMEL01_11204 [Colletotrichum melonis]